MLLYISLGGIKVSGDFSEEISWASTRLLMLNRVTAANKKLPVSHFISL